MILVDIGNSGLRASRIAERSLFVDQCVYRLSWSAAVASQRKPTPEQESAPNQRWCELNDTAAFEWLVQRFSSHPSDPWMISCVQHTALLQLQKSLHKLGIHHAPRVVNHADLDLQINVDHPDKTGIDRLLAAYAAWQLSIDSVAEGSAIGLAAKANTSLQPYQPIVIVQAGTAVTVDFVDGDGVFQGGAIMPGLGLALQLLAAGTEQLPWLGNHLVDSVPDLPGKNTTQAISAGVNAALAGGVAHLVNRYRTQTHSGIKVYVSGGDGRLLTPYIPQPCEFVDHLVLRGLSLVARSR
jgi:type III pantothenate kinase